MKKGTQKINTTTGHTDTKKKVCKKCGGMPCECQKKDSNIKSCKSNKTLSKSLCVRVIADIGWGNSLYIRGEGGTLTWDKGILMENLDANHWIWKYQSDVPLTFKLLINDTQWSDGENYQIKPNETLDLTPTFSQQS